MQSPFVVAPLWRQSPHVSGYQALGMLLIQGTADLWLSSTWSGSSCPVSFIVVWGCRIMCVVQSYITGLKLEGLSLGSDMQYIRDSAGRLMRCLFEICLKRGWANLTEKALGLCKMVSRRMWASQVSRSLHLSASDCPPDGMPLISINDILPPLPSPSRLLTSIQLPLSLVSACWPGRDPCWTC